MSIQPVNLFNFGEGHLNFRIKIPANVTFKIGVIDTWNNQYYVNFPAGQTKYGGNSVECQPAVWAMAKSQDTTE